MTRNAILSKLGREFTDKGQSPADSSTYCTVAFGSDSFGARILSVGIKYVRVMDSGGNVGHYGFECISDVRC